MKMNTIIDKIDRFLLKQEKIYLKPGESAPKGKQMKIGPQKGRYYETEEKAFIGQAKRKRLTPTTELQKKHAQKFEYKGRSIINFPGRSQLYAIPKSIRITQGIKPLPEDLNIYKEIWKLTKSPSPINYCDIDDMIILSGKKPEEVYNHLIWLVKNQKATCNIDRWGNVVFIKLLGDIKLRPDDIKTIEDVDTYSLQHPVNGQVKSRYKTMVDLYGEHNADKMMRELEVRSWDLRLKKNAGIK